MLVEMAIGDAYGAGFEYANPEFVAANHRLTSYVKHPKHNLVPGSYTDDTQMSIANAEVICTLDFDQAALAQAYVACFKRDQREGYAGGFYRFLVEVKDGAEFLERIKPNSDKSGGAMRALPFGIYPNIETVKGAAALQAAITHNTPDGVNAAVAAALMAHYFLYNLGRKADLGRFIAGHVAGEWDKPWSEPVGEKGWMAVRAAITAVVAGDSMTAILDKSVAFTGDVDTVAALALGAAAHCSEVKQDLPALLVDGLENGPFGRDFLRALDEKLMQTMEKLRSQSKAQVAAVSASSSSQVSQAHPTAARAPAESAVLGARILVVRAPEMWTGMILHQDFLVIPEVMDVGKEEQAWFAAGGDGSGIKFADYLIAHGAVRLTPEIWNINYQ
jgi:ADP-ribosyl-[dinitrogen reductase] hydrolase